MTQSDIARMAVASGVTQADIYNLERFANLVKAQWNGLTLEEVEEAILKEYSYNYKRVRLVCNEIQRKLKEKNT